MTSQQVRQSDGPGLLATSIQRAKRVAVSADRFGENVSTRNINENKFHACVSCSLKKSPVLLLFDKTNKQTNKHSASKPGHEGLGTSCPLAYKHPNQGLPTVRITDTQFPIMLQRCGVSLGRHNFFLPLPVVSPAPAAWFSGIS